MITGQFVVNAFDMVFLLFIIDFVSLTFSTDTVSWSREPESWSIKPLIKKGFVLGVLSIAEAFVWLVVGKQYFGIVRLHELHSFGFTILFFTGIFNILIVRTPGRFYKQPIGKLLLYAIIADVILALCILKTGLFGFSILSTIVIASSVLYFLLCSFFINDWVKVKVNSTNYISTK